MAEARSQDAWNHTATLLALIANCHRDPRRTRAFTTADFHPSIARAAAPPPPVADLSVLRSVFIDHHLELHP